MEKYKNKPNVSNPAAVPNNPAFNQTTYINEFMRNKYDRIALLLPKGKKKNVKDRANELNKSVNEYINALIDEDLKGY